MKSLKAKTWLVLFVIAGMAAYAPVLVLAKDANPKPAAASVLAGKSQPNVKVDLNKASLEELESIKGIGPALAERIVNYRNENGKFNSAQDLTNVKGIGQGKFERIKDQVMV